MKKTKGQVDIPFEISPLASTPAEAMALAMRLLEMHREGLLGGEVMPEDARPNLPRDSVELFHYLTLGMSLNFQRNSYALWKAATDAFNSASARWVFRPESVIARSEEDLRLYLVKHKVALQPEKHVKIWRAISIAISELFRGDIRNLFEETGSDVGKIGSIIQVAEKRKFPYLSGLKIFNYWLYVLDTYTDVRLANRQLLNVAPDTHVIQASLRLGVVKQVTANQQELQKIVSNSWAQLLDGTGIAPIDVHTPLWLWSKGGFKGINV